MKWKRNETEQLQNYTVFQKKFRSQNTGGKTGKNTNNYEQLNVYRVNNYVPL